MAGKLKGRVLEIPEDAGCRPMLGIAKKALFDILRPRVNPGQSFLDLFGGTGSVGIEAWSRGIDEIVINELDPGRNVNISGNLGALGLTGTVRLFRFDFKEMLSYALRNGLSFDYVFAAPPYRESGFYSAVLDFFRENPLCLRKGGLLILEHHAKYHPDTAGFTTVKDNHYGTTKLLFLSFPPAVAAERIP